MVLPRGASWAAMAARTSDAASSVSCSTPTPAHGHQHVRNPSVEFVTAPQRDRRYAEATAVDTNHYNNEDTSDLITQRSDEKGIANQHTGADVT